MSDEKKPAKQSSTQASKASDAAAGAVDPAKADTMDTLKVVDKKSGP